MFLYFSYIFAILLQKAAQPVELGAVADLSEAKASVALVAVTSLAGFFSFASSAILLADPNLSLGAIGSFAMCGGIFGATLGALITTICGKWPEGKLAGLGTTGCVYALGAFYFTKEFRLFSRYWGNIVEAAEGKNLSRVKYLVESCNANIGESNDFGYTAFHCAARDGNLEMLKYLIGKGKKFINIDDGYGWTPLHWAVKNEYLDVVKYLVEQGADVNTKDAYDISPLHVAAEYGHLEIVTLFVEHEADVNSKDENNKTARDWAEKHSIKNYLELAEAFYAVNDKKMSFYDFTNKYLSNAQTKTTNLTDTYSLLHLGTREFFDQFVAFAQEYKLPTPTFGDEKKIIYQKLAERPGSKKTFWLKECFKHLDGAAVKTKYDAVVDAIIGKLARTEAMARKVLKAGDPKKKGIMESEMLVKEKNKILQQKKELSILENKYVGSDNKIVQKKFEDLKIIFK